ncbi:aspartate aminotransferase family protein [Occultella kanbiaonis]|uniref:aspartate aminotransferase family protein n=1 Tax=Occultella kanbiaonis TaxID=2675754 RepID=UPI001A97D4FE|nr:aspartate aminotransferase family protein [Occultella kanbiaonis]
MSLIESWPGSAQRWERAKGSLGGGVSTGMRAQMKPHPLYFESGQGAHLRDVDGNTYTDYVLGWGPVIIGHAHPHLVATVTRQLPLGQTFGASHDLEYEIAERVLAAIPGMDRVLWSNTGTEADQTALRLARAATGRRRFVKFEGHYHGWSDAMLLGYRPDANGALDRPASRGQNPSALTDVTILPWNDAAAVRAVLTDPDQDIAAVFTEPVLCNSGVLEPAPGFLAELRAICDETGTLLVFDEVITGFRIAHGGGTERYGVTPDLAVLAKAIAGGFPLAALAGRGDLIDEVTRGVVHAGTYNGNPVVLAAAGATLDVLAEPGTYERFEDLGGTLADGFADAFRAAGRPVVTRNVGPVVQVVPGTSTAETFKDFTTADWDFYDRFTIELLRRGVFSLPGGRWYLSTAHTAADVERTVAAARDALDAL